MYFGALLMTTLITSKIVNVLAVQELDDWNTVLLLDEMTWSGDDGSSGSGWTDSETTNSECRHKDALGCRHNVQVIDIRQLSSVTSATDGDLTSGDGATSFDYTSGSESDVDEVIYVEGPRGGELEDDVVLPGAAEVYRQAASETTSTSDSRQPPPSVWTSAQLTWIKPRPTTQGNSLPDVLADTSPTDDVLPVWVKSTDVDEDDHQSTTSRYMALAINVALLAGIVFVVAVFLAVLVSFVVHRRRRRRRRYPGDLSSSSPGAPAGSVGGVTRGPRVKPSCHAPTAGLIHATVRSAPDADKPRLFVSVSKVGDPKEWFV